MQKIVIIADDLTGANATGVLLARERLKTVTLTSLDNISEATGWDVVAVTTNSRSIEPQQAYKRVFEAAVILSAGENAFFNKRIDSTLRGNIGAEIDAVLDCLRGNTAVVVASFPSSHRVSIGGFLMVDNIPLEMTAVAKDPKNPIYSSMVVDIIQKQTKRKVEYISLQKVLKGVDAVKEELMEKIRLGIEIIVIDATTDDDIKIVAKACAQTKQKIITVDPGPFTYFYAKEIMGKNIPAAKIGKKIIAAIGSVSDLTRRQIQELSLNRNSFVIKVNPLNFLESSSREKEIAQTVQKVLKNITKYEIFVVTTTEEDDDILDLNAESRKRDSTPDDISNIISSSLAAIADKCLEKSEGVIGGVYTSGGDVTVAFCEQTGAHGVEVKDNIIPLAVYARLIKGKYPHLPIITKGGMIGDDDALIKCADYLLTKTSTE